MSAQTTQVASAPSSADQTTKTTATSSASKQATDTSGNTAVAQATDTSTAQPPQEPATPSPDQSPVEKKPKQDTTTRSTAFASGGDSAVGSIDGIKAPESIRVSSGGAATYSIAITVPPATADVAPRLAFNFNSQGENSLLGVGWSVSGLPVIHRCGATYAQDGFRGTVNYDANDRFCLDATRSIPIA